MNFEKTVQLKSKKQMRNIVLPEAEISLKMLEAGLMCAKQKLCKITLLAKSDKLDYLKSDYIDVINVLQFKRYSEMIELFYELRKHKGISFEDAKELLSSNLTYFGTMLVKMDIVDGMVAGACTPTKDVLLPAFQIIKSVSSNKVSSVFILEAKKNKFIKKDKLLFMADASIIIEPTAVELAQIAINAADMAKLFDIEPKVAMLSHSTINSGTGSKVELIKDAVQILANDKVSFDFEGPLQSDSALRPDVAKIKLSSSKIGGEANVLVFPDISSANIAVKLFQVANACNAVGPICVGLNKPINDVSRGASVNEIVLSICLTSVQCK